MPTYVGRFAPSPTGLLHAGSLAAALASWLDARAHGGRWLLRIEDVDAPRCVAGAAEGIARQLAACGLLPDEAPLVQSTRGAVYARALAHLQQAGLAYPCACTRSEIAARCAAAGVQAQRGEELPYPGTCRPEAGGLRGREGRAWRLHVGRCLQRLSFPSPPPAQPDRGRGAGVRGRHMRTGSSARCAGAPPHPRPSPPVCRWRGSGGEGNDF